MKTAILKKITSLVQVVRLLNSENVFEISLVEADMEGVI